MGVVVESVVMVRVDEPDPVMVVGLNVPVAPAGRPLTPRVTTPAKPFTAVTVDVYVVPAPAAMLRLAGVAEKPKSWPPVTTKETPAVWFKDPLVPLRVNG